VEPKFSVTVVELPKPRDHAAPDPEEVANMQHNGEVEMKDVVALFVSQ
jgi:hypothetical protein